jgi:hypothetical protein
VKFRPVFLLFLMMPLSACSVGCLDDGAILGRYVAIPDHERVMVEGIDRAGGRACYWSASGGPSPTNSSAWASCQATGQACTIVAIGSHVLVDPTPLNLPLAYAAIGAGQGAQAAAWTDARDARRRPAPARSAPAPVDHSPPVEASYSPPKP